MPPPPLPFKIGVPPPKEASFVINTNKFFHNNLEGGAVEFQSLESFTIWEDIGAGACSRVKRAVHTASGTPVALKQVDVYDSSKRHQLVKELNALRSNLHPNLVALAGAIQDGGSIFIALEFIALMVSF